MSSEKIVSNSNILSDETRYIKGFLYFIWDNFEDFITRFILPSIFLFILLFTIDKISNNAYIVNILIEIMSKNSTIINFIIILSIISSMSYTMKILVQLIFDSFIKGNYDIIIPFTKKRTNSCCYKFLRDSVIDKLIKQLSDKYIKKLLKEVKNKENDYILYQIIKSLYQIDDKKFNTSSKEGGVIALSIIIASLYYSYLNNDIVSFQNFVIISVAWFVGFYYIKSRYKARAYQIYIDILNDKINKRYKLAVISSYPSQIDSCQN